MNATLTKSQIVSVCVPSLLGSYYLRPTDVHAIFLQIYLICNSTCSVAVEGALITGGRCRGINGKDPKNLSSEFALRLAKLTKQRAKVGEYKQFFATCFRNIILCTSFAVYCARKLTTRNYACSPFSHLLIKLKILRFRKKYIELMQLHLLGINKQTCLS